MGRGGIGLAMVAAVTLAPLAVPQHELIGAKARERSIQADIERAYVMVVAKVPRGYSGSGGGSGVFVSDHLILTVSHNQPTPDTQMLVVTSKGQTFPTEVVARDSRRDLMILRIKAKGPGKLSVSSRNADLWQRVALVGSPLGSPGVCLLGTVAGISSVKGTMLVDARVTYGVSGAAVVALDGRDAGKIIGVLFRVWGNSHMHMGIAVNAENVRNFLIASGAL